MNANEKLRGRDRESYLRDELARAHDQKYPRGLGRLEREGREMRKDRQETVKGDCRNCWNGGHSGDSTRGPITWCFRWREVRGSELGCPSYRRSTTR
jgi:hypothetical protein